MTTSELFQLEPCRAPLSPYPTILAKGFRIFFLCAGFAAAILIPLWLLMLEGHFVAPTRFAPAAWHGHEMAFGYAFAVVGGFLLTAVYNWVGQPHLNGWKLALLALLWLLGRVAMLASGLLPAWLVALVDASFLPVLAAVLTPPLIKARKWPNLGFMFLLLLAGGYNLAFHLDAADIVEAGGSNALLTSVVEILV
ncbi:MAG: NnrS family protein, partial [Rhodospirillales bacterium]